MVLLLGVIACTACWGMSLVYTAARTVHMVSEVEKHNHALHAQVTREESHYYDYTRGSVSHRIEKSSHVMVAYSGRDQHVRYAQVGGAVYSLLDSNDL